MITVDFDKLKNSLAVKFGYTPYYDDYNVYKLIRPHKTYKLIDKILNPYVDKVTLDFEECGKLAEILTNVYLKDNQNELDNFIKKLVVTRTLRINLVIEKGRVTNA